MNKRFSLLSNLPMVALALLGLPCLQASAGLGSLWSDSSAQPRSMFADKKAHSIGDIVTIVIQENNGATRNNNTTTAKKGSEDASIASFLYGPTASALLTKGGVYPA